MTGFLLDLIRERRRPVPKTRRCPVNHAVCGYGCCMYQACSTQPGEVLKLMGRIDEQVIEALYRRLRRGASPSRSRSPRSAPSAPARIGRR